MEQPCPVQPDAQIGGRYSVRRPLGRAAGCELFDGVQLFTHRAVTLKTAKRSTEADRRLTEARALAQVSHPVLPSVLDALIGPDDQVCVVFEHVRGRSLEGLLTARGRLDADEALHWFRSLADAVGTLHAAGWVGVTPGVSSILRAQLLAPVRALLPTSVVDLRTEDICTNGLRVVGSQPLPEGATIRLRMALPVSGRLVNVPCVVQSVEVRRGPSGTPRAFAMCLEFDAAESELRREAAHYVHSLGA